MSDTVVKFEAEKVIKATSANIKLALKAGATIVKGDAVMRCPVDTGQLRNSIQEAIYDDYAIVDSNVEYAPHVEYGTSRQKAQPFLRPALDENIEDIKRVMGDILKGALK